jgi:hypothetical protein
LQTPNYAPPDLGFPSRARRRLRSMAIRHRQMHCRLPVGSIAPAGSKGPKRIFFGCVD